MSFKMQSVSCSGYKSGYAYAYLCMNVCVRMWMCVQNRRGRWKESLDRVHPPQRNKVEGTIHDHFLYFKIEHLRTFVLSSPPPRLSFRCNTQRLFCTPPSLPLFFSFNFSFSLPFFPF
ncbi:hypothetical protein BKA57DRAFT_30051 [Linnemannia elongata]|nr:hypothetical protein BKA57DRAFT_30051 [Linnemannia elongata]